MNLFFENSILYFKDMVDEMLLLGWDGKWDGRWDEMVWPSLCFSLLTLESGPENAKILSINKK